MRWSPSAARSCLMQEFRPWSKQTKVPLGQENIAQVLARHHLATMFYQVLQQCARLRTQAQTAAPAAQFAASRVEHELPEVIIRAAIF